MEISLQERDVMALSAIISSPLQAAQMEINDAGRLVLLAWDGDEMVLKFLDENMLGEKYLSKKATFQDKLGKSHLARIKKQ